MTCIFVICFWKESCITCICLSSDATCLIISSCTSFISCTSRVHAWLRKSVQKVTLLCLSTCSDSSAGGSGAGTSCLGRGDEGTGDKTCCSERGGEGGVTKLDDAEGGGECSGCSWWGGAGLNEAGGYGRDDDSGTAVTEADEGGLGFLTMMTSDELTCLMVHHLKNWKVSHVLKALRMMLKASQSVNSVAHHPILYRHPACTFWKLKWSKSNKTKNGCWQACLGDIISISLKVKIIRKWRYFAPLFQGKKNSFWWPWKGPFVLTIWQV